MLSRSKLFIAINFSVVNRRIDAINPQPEVKDIGKAETAHGSYVA